MPGSIAKENKRPPGGIYNGIDNKISLPIFQAGVDSILKCWIAAEWNKQDP